MSGADDPDDGLYPMRVAARLAGLGADTIRAWERRYGAVTPARTDGQARRYSEAEVRRLTLLREATERGHAISAIGRLPDGALRELVKQESAGPRPDVAHREPHSREIHAYLEAVERFEVRRALDIITRSSANLDPRSFCLRFLEPALSEIGRRWEHGEATVVHEHIVSTHVKMVLGVYTRLGATAERERRVAFLTPEGHQHEFAIHIGAILATIRGVEPIVLGPDVPYALLDGFVREVEPDALVFGVSRDMNADELAAFRDVVERLARKTRVVVGCRRGGPLYEQVEGAEFVGDFDTLDAFLETLG